MTRHLYCVSVKRGTKTIYKYASKMKDAVYNLQLKPGEQFTYVHYVHTGKVVGEWHGKSWSTSR